MFEGKGFFPTPHTQKISIPSLPIGLEGMRILHLSDLHLDKKTPLTRVEQIISTANDLNPDIIVITGDILDTKAKNIPQHLSLLCGFTKPTYFISGNHDLFHGLDALVEAFNAPHITFMDNKVLHLSYNNTEYILAGLGDRMSKWFKKTRDIETLEALHTQTKPLFFLAHQPKDYDIALRAKASLFLAGHTHGGQIFPFHYLVLLEQPFLAGQHLRENMAIYINRGLGNWGINLRFRAPSEITLLELYKGD